MLTGWKAHLQLLLFVYRTTKHATTGLSPYEVLFGYVPTPLQIASMPGPVIPDPAEYSAILKRTLYDLRELVEANTAQSTERQQFHYKSSQTYPQLKPNQKVLLSNPIRGKLSPRWTGPWTVLCMKSPTTVQLEMAAASRTVHINRTLLLEEDKDHQVPPNWVPPLFTHEEILQQPDQVSTSDETTADSSTSGGPSEVPYVTRSGRVVKPVERYGISD